MVNKACQISMSVGLKETQSRAMSGKYDGESNPSHGLNQFVCGCSFQDNNIPNLACLNLIPHMHARTQLRSTPRDPTPVEVTSHHGLDVAQLGEDAQVVAVRLASLSPAVHVVPERQDELHHRPQGIAAMDVRV